MNDHQDNVEPTSDELRAARITAYVLGELPAAEREEIEAVMEDDPALRTEVEAIAAVSGDLTRAYASEPSLALTGGQRAEILSGGAAGAGEDTPGWRTFSFRNRVLLSGSMAAACVLVIWWMGSQLPVEESSLVVIGDTSDRYRGTPGPANEPAETKIVVAPGRSEDQSIAVDSRADRGLVSVTPRDELARGLGTDGKRAAAIPSRVTATPAETPPSLSGIAGGAEFYAHRKGQPEDALLGLRSQNEARLNLGDDSQLDWYRHRGHPVLPEAGGEQYGRLVDNAFQSPWDAPLSTFSIDVDTMSYANVRRMLMQGEMPPKDAVRIEEMLNYFIYDYEPASGAHPFSVSIDHGQAPWSASHRLVRIGLRAEEIDMQERPPANLVFLLDVSGSMNTPMKLPLVKRAMKLLVDRLHADDRVAIVVYAGASGLVLPSTPCARKQEILGALEQLHAGGSTNGGAGIALAYSVAQEQFIDGGVNRVILCTDGDFNVGTTSKEALVSLIEVRRDSGVFLSVLGFGSGNWSDERMEELSNHGNGNAAYIDSLAEARRVLVEQVGGTLVTVASDVKIQVEFNPARVGAYRLIGYANRMLAAEDFNDDTKDAGEIGSGHTVTALYEIIPVGVEVPSTVDPLQYQRPPATEPRPEVNDNGDLLTVKLRYKEPGETISQLLQYSLRDEPPAGVSEDFQFATAVAAFGMLLRDAPDKGSATWEQVIEHARSGLGRDPGGYRAEFIRLAEIARSMATP